MSSQTHSWQDARVTLRDDLLAVVSAQLHAGRTAKAVAARLDKVRGVIRAVEQQGDAELQDDLVELVRDHVEAFRALTRHRRAVSKLYSLAVTRRWLASYIAHLRGGDDHPAIGDDEWRGILTPIWHQALEQSTPLLDTTIDEVRDARTPNAAALKFLCGAYPDEGLDDDLGRKLDRVDLNPYK